MSESTSQPFVLIVDDALYNLDNIATTLLAANDSITKLGNYIESKTGSLDMAIKALEEFKSSMVEAKKKLDEWRKEHGIKGKGDAENMVEDAELKMESDVCDRLQEIYEDAEKSGVLCEKWFEDQKATGSNELSIESSKA
ncbi:hypothetical protein P280DRAFT_13700 [Massarina eburnea CBS 473.64]|uniref:Uncharacterized protein n=1 Tax=Massarina eburnea CBS 473.64 TaxID=1395130 RepID=A0A6A6SHT4_9PLEO|nr:hypothetical protein P280DRAFT_13700 [Massarina eburnea CBS 473.64]